MHSSLEKKNRIDSEYNKIKMYRTLVERNGLKRILL